MHANYANPASHTVDSAILTTCVLCLCLLILYFSIGLWNCQSAVNKADFITSITSHSRLNLMALTETWIKPKDNATPAALSNNFSFSHTPRLTGRGGGTGLLISNNWKFTPLSSPSINSSFESHSVTITYPLKINFVVVYHPPGPLVNFVEELDLLLSTFPEDGTPLVILGDFNIHLDKPQAADFHTLLASFDLKRVLTTATHKSGNQLDLIYTRHCSTDHVLVTPLHTSDHFLLTLNLNMILDTSHTLHMSLFDITYARSHPPGYLLWFHLRFLPLNSYHILMLIMLLTLSVPLWCLVLILSAP